MSAAEASRDHDYITAVFGGLREHACRFDLNVTDVQPSRNNHSSMMQIKAISKRKTPGS